MCIRVCVFIIGKTVFHTYKKKKNLTILVTCSHTVWNFVPTVIKVEISHEFTAGRIC